MRGGADSPLPRRWIDPTRATPRCVLASRLRRGGWLSLGCRRLAPRVEPQRERTQPPIVPRADLAPQARRGGGEALRHLRQGGGATQRRVTSRCASFSRLRRGGWRSLGRCRLAARAESPRGRTRSPAHHPACGLAPQARPGVGAALRRHRPRADARPVARSERYEPHRPTRQRAPELLALPRTPAGRRCRTRARARARRKLAAVRRLRIVPRPAR